MKNALLSILMLLSGAASLQADPAEFDRQQIAFKKAVEEAIKDPRENHLKELGRLRDTYTRAGNLDAANKVQAQMDAIQHSIAFPDAPVANPPSAKVLGTPAPELDRQVNLYRIAIEQAIRRPKEAYVVELQKLHATSVRNADLAFANKTKEEMDRVRSGVIVVVIVGLGGGPAGAPAVAPVGGPTVPMQELRWIEGKDWLTDAGTLFKFGRNGDGENSRNGTNKTPFTWKVLDTGLVEVQVRTTKDSPPRAWYIHFKTRAEADYGSSPNKLDLRMRTR